MFIQIQSRDFYFHVMNIYFRPFSYCYIYLLPDKFYDSGSAVITPSQFWFHLEQRNQKICTFRLFILFTVLYTTEEIIVTMFLNYMILNFCFAFLTVYCQTGKKRDYRILYIIVYVCIEIPISYQNTILFRYT